MDPTTADEKAAKKKAHEHDEAMKIVHGPLGKGVFKLGFPLAIAMVLQSTFNLVDMLIVAGLTNAGDAIAALAICDLVAMIPTILGNGVANAAAAMVARRVGEKDPAGASFVTWQSISLVAIISLVFGLVGAIFADPITRGVFGAKGDMASLTASYMAVIMAGGFSILLLLQVCAILRALGDGTTPLVLLVGSNVLNFFWAILFVYGNGPAPEAFGWMRGIADALGIEPMGVVGTAWSTLGSRSIALAIGLVVLSRRKGLMRFAPRSLLPTRDVFKRLYEVAWPNSAQFVLRIAIIEVYLAIVTRLFTTESDHTASTAYGICIRLETLVLFLSMGWGAAASTYVGQNLGAGDKARALKAGWYAAGFNLAFVAVFQVIFLGLAPQIIGIFDKDPQVLQYGVEYLQIVGASYLLFGLAVVLSQALTGAGLTMLGFKIDLVAVLAFIAPATIVALVALDLTVLRTWILIAAGNVVSGILYVFWYKRGHWVRAA